jgi:hypothetical protein
MQRGPSDFGHDRDRHPEWGCGCKGIVGEMPACATSLECGHEDLTCFPAVLFDVARTLVPYGAKLQLGTCRPQRENPVSKKKNQKRADKRRAEKKADRSRRPAKTHVSVAQGGHAALMTQPLGAIQTGLALNPQLLGQGTFPTNLNAIASGYVSGLSGSLDNILRWRCATLLHFSDRINAFLTRASQFDAAILSGQLEAADLIVKSIPGQFGVSLWWVTARLQVAGFAGGLTMLRDTASKIDNETDNAFVQAFVSVISEKLESTTSPESIKETLDQICALTPERRTPTARAFVDHFRFHADSFEVDRVVDFQDVLCRDSDLPIIDQFISFVRISQLISATPNIRYLPILRQCVARLASSVDDIRLNLLSTYLTGRSVPTTNAPNAALPSAIDTYTRGRYAETIALSIREISQGTEVLEFYELCAKSMLYIEQSPSTLDLKRGRISHDILFALFELLENGPDSLRAAATLRRCAFVMENSRFATQLAALVTRQTMSTSCVNSSVLFLLNSASVTPRFAEIFPDLDVRERFISKLDPIWSASPSVRLFSRTGDVILDIHPLRSGKYQARRAMANGDHALAIEIYRRTLRLATPAMPVALEIAGDLFRAYVEVNRPADALEVLVESHTARPLGPTDKRLVQLLSQHPRKVFTHIFDRLAWPLAFYLVSIAGDARPGDLTRKQFGAYDDFMARHHVTRPTQLPFSQWSDPSDECQLICFLRFVCVPEVMDSSLSFSSSEEVEKERISVCQALLQLDPNSSDVYSQEIARRTQTMMVRRALTYLGDSKIYVDTDGIIKSLDRAFRSRCERFLLLVTLAEGHRRLVVFKSLDQDTNKPVVDFRDLALYHFAELFTELKSRFISSNEFGLDSYLSVRIRHGTLSAQLRRSFEREKLITQRNATTNEYEPNVHWTDWLIPAPSDARRDPCLEAFNVFSRTVDSIIDDVKQNWIQVRSTAKLTGMFDFSYSATELDVLYKAVAPAKDFEAFTGGCIADLWKRTERSLENINDLTFDAA